MRPSDSASLETSTPHGPGRFAPREGAHPKERDGESPTSPCIAGTSGETIAFMPQYEPLYRWLNGNPNQRVNATFHELEAVLGVRLPRTARNRRQWWANEHAATTKHIQCHAWLQAGFSVEEVDLGNEIVTFVRAN